MINICIFDLFDSVRNDVNVCVWTTFQSTGNQTSTKAFYCYRTNKSFVRAYHSRHPHPLPCHPIGTPSDIYILSSICIYLYIYTDLRPCVVFHIQYTVYTNNTSHGKFNNFNWGAHISLLQFSARARVLCVIVVLKQWSSFWSFVRNRLIV